MTRDPYQVLGVSPLASAAEIKSAYRALVKQHHPDAAEGMSDDPERILEINAAWELLGDSEARKRFDAGRSQRSARATAQTRASSGKRRRGAADDAEERPAVGRVRRGAVARRGGLHLPRGRVQPLLVHHPRQGRAQARHRADPGVRQGRRNPHVPVLRAQAEVPAHRAPARAGAAEAGHSPG